MRFKYWIIATALVITLSLGGFSLIYVGRVSQDMLGSLEQVRAAVGDGNFQNALQKAETLHADWHRLRIGLQLFLSHRDTDAVDMTLVRLVAAIEKRDTFGISRELADGDTALHNLPEREAPTMGNVL